MGDKKLVNTGSWLMLIGALSFIIYGLVFLIKNFTAEGFELGVETLNGVTIANLESFNPAIVHYISHLHVATAGFIIAAGIAVAALSWYGVRNEEFWAWTTAVVTPVVGLGIALPMHYMDLFDHDWVTHLGPIYLGTLVFVIGAVISLVGMRK